LCRAAVLENMKLIYEKVGKNGKRKCNWEEEEPLQ
jgi:hypothetical protein